MDMARIDDWLSAIPSKYTRKTYKSGIKKFEEFYQKPIEDLLSRSDEETGHIIEKFYAWLKDRGHIAHSLIFFGEYRIDYIHLLILMLLKIGKFDFMKKQ